MKYSTKPTDPRSAKQLSIRAMVRFLNIHFAEMNLEDQAYWGEVAAGLHITAQNLYVKRNMIWWTTDRPPSEDVDHAGPDFPTQPYLWPPIVTGRRAQLRAVCNPLGDSVAIVFHRSLQTAFTPNWSNAVHVGQVLEPLSYYWDDTPLKPGTYYYRAMAFSHYANFSNTSIQQSAVIP